MTENKRFKVIETITHEDRRIYELTKNDIGYYNFKGEKLLAHLICNELNRLLEENEQLKIDLGIAEDNHKLDKEIIDDIHNEFQRVKKENEQLKADNNRLVNETARIVAEHQNKVLNLIDKRIDKCEPIDYARNIDGDFPVFDCETATEIRVLNELKRELQE